MHKRNQWVDLIGVFFSLGIFLTHLNSLAQPQEQVNQIYCFGFLGVEFFFVLSGYLMANSASKNMLDESVSIEKKTISFLWKKYKRILPYYAVAWCIGFVVEHASQAISWKQVAKDAIQSIPAFMNLAMAGYPVYQAINSAWYISAMLLSMLLLYPMLLLWKKRFSLIIAPIIVVGMYGFLFRKYGNLAVINQLAGDFIYAGLLRGLAGISLGCICYEGARLLAGKALTAIGKKALTCLEVLGYTIIFISMNTQALMRPDFYVVALLVPTIMLSFSGQSHTSSFHVSRINLEEISLSIFLADYPARVLTQKLLPSALRDERILTCVVLLIVISGSICVASSFLNKKSRKIAFKIRKLLLAKN